MCVQSSSVLYSTVLNVYSTRCTVCVRWVFGCATENGVRACVLYSTALCFNVMLCTVRAVFYGFAAEYCPVLMARMYSIIMGVGQTADAKLKARAECTVQHSTALQEITTG